MAMVGNRYQLNEQLGVGGMGTVFRSIDTQTQKIVAIKQLKPEIISEAQIERFIREGEALRELNHPNIVKMLDSIEEDGDHYLVMEYINGGDLKSLIEQNGAMGYRQCVDMAIDLADALTRAHRIGIIHRDLKPANVLIGADGRLRLTDFGVAHVVNKERVTDTDAVIGTLDYLSPEALNGESIDARTDIWAFGIMLFEMLTGERPFKGDSLTAIVTAILTNQLPDIQSLSADVPVDLQDLVYRMLERDPLARISSVRHIGAELEDILHGRNNTLNPTRFDTPLPESLIYRPPTNNLPTQSTPFVGRETELAELAKLLKDPQLRLMTIVAPGGMGKTRLSVELASRVLDESLHETSSSNGLFSDGAFFVALAPLATVEQIAPAIASATSYQFNEDRRTEKTQILDYLKNKQMLLVMDNFEHLMEGTKLVAEILNYAPHIKILATSRQRLGQQGEAVFHLGGMDFPEWETPEDAIKYAAVKLFVNSAQRARLGWELTQDNLDHIARICRLAQGMPLGIVLAAAWLAMLTEGEIVQELEKSIDILADASGELPERQQSIRAVMEYSWHMMNSAEQSVFMKLAVFYNGFTRKAAERVSGANLYVLLSLVNKSLLSRDINTGRYEMHEFLRQYALEKLKESEQYETVLHDHCQYYMTLGGETGRRTWRTLETLMQDINHDRENLIVAWRTAIERRDEQLLEIGIDAVVYFWFQTQFNEANRLLLDSLAIVREENIALRGKIMALLPFSLMRLGKVEESLAYMNQSKELLDKADTEPFYSLLQLLVQATFLQFQISFEAAIKALDDLAISTRDSGYNFVSFAADSFSTYLSSVIGNIDEAEKTLQNNLETADSKNIAYWTHRMLMNLGEIALSRGDYDKARSDLNRSLQLSVKNRAWQAIIDNNVLLAQIALDEGNLEEVDERLNYINTLADNMGTPATSIADAKALRARYYLAIGEEDKCYATLAKLTQHFSIVSAGFTVVAVAELLIHRQQIDQAGRILKLVASKPMAPAVRGNITLFLNQMNESVEPLAKNLNSDAEALEVLRQELADIFKTVD